MQRPAAPSIALLLVLLVPVPLVAVGSGAPSIEDPDSIEIPLGLPGEIPGLDSSPQTQALIRLGERLFSDKNLSVDRTTSCISCHPPDHGHAHPARYPTGAYGRKTPRSAATLINRALGKNFGWLGQVPTIEELALLPFDDVNEFDLPVEKALERLMEDAEYVALFEAASGRGPNKETLARALASHVRTILVGNSPVDRFRAGDVTALTATERQGMWIYESKGGCWRCHAGQGNFTDEKFHNTGVGVKEGVPAEGRREITGKEGDRGRFKTPTLRGVGLSDPYMHDGSLATLEEVVEFYRRGGNPNQNLDPAIQPLSLTDEEASSLVAFLQALSRS